ncbi:MULTISPECIES: sugar phosphate isomerase/epimerase family protein [Butyrivibrio]|uniref:sugar phosphate isomerase/epimerase family protein n=1 Tax=Butyrivibrio TaxID=830 RepID=UPI00041A6318|nr:MULTISPECIES: sugar phosphate isomerase/epimerase [Butyrivibrio]SEQ31261.1 Sugar phosphate isomerase/epimerase [Butyrivibrio sp. TB]
MKDTVLTGVQQIMIGSRCNSYESALSTLQSIKSTGYDGIELNDFMIRPTPFIVRLLTKFAGMPTGNGGKLDWKKLISESGLKVISLHSNLNSIEENPEAVAKEALSFGTNTVVITGMYRFDYGNASEVKKLSERLNNAGKALLPYGVKLLYHNHNVELQKVSEDKTAYDLIVENTDPQYVNFELDTYWMADGGADVTALVNKLSDRMVMWHINDRGCRKKGPFITPILKEDAAELGTGNMPLDAIFKTVKANTGVEAIVLETHKNWIDNDPIKSLTVSAEWFRKNR